MVVVVVVEAVGFGNSVVLTSMVSVWGLAAVVGAVGVDRHHQPTLHPSCHPHDEALDLWIFVGIHSFVVSHETRSTGVPLQLQEQAQRPLHPKFEHPPNKPSKTQTPSSDIVLQHSETLV